MDGTPSNIAVHTFNEHCAKFHVGPLCHNIASKVQFPTGLYGEDENIHGLISLDMVQKPTYTVQLHTFTYKLSTCD